MKKSALNLGRIFYFKKVLLKKWPTSYKNVGQNNVIFQ